ncbi:ATP-dependent sacrificial sulfur transferase LarE [Streptomyces sp. S.PNR 29]|uniref:ATP-dependent sacrificial sulfur transferase LarE n=1 Tax=Streptomyces sp. S.PNR 29 TaxID=2973805 RepID=UPI0025B188B9|nr:ATP-dependent sacrificial sulfur transferase LarE [Streptomyces sp. S.PNR 29]MDN0198871.1 ATP-dependent sacrificial sulfur transferase LarE [Streptomyces sp. S.PNR 29]
MNDDTSALAHRLLVRLEEIGPVAVAFSGGADSALVLAAAVRALGPARVLAVTALSESLASGEQARAHRFATDLGVVHLTPRTNELTRPGYRANGPDRCYFCKSEVLDAIAALARGHGFENVATGTNADDALDPHRPGIRAGHERGVHTPLLDTRLSKADVRRLSRHWSLPTWNKPATPCLASRIRYGIEVTPHRLARVDRAESALRALLAAHGITVGDLRVRDLGDTVRVEVDAPLADRVSALPGLRRTLTEAGFGEMPQRVEPFRSGRLNSETTAHTER